MTRDEMLAEQGREVASVWRSCISDVCAALDTVANAMLDGRKKAEREKGAAIKSLSDLVWSMRNPAPRSYVEADALGSTLRERARASLVSEKGEG